MEQTSVKEVKDLVRVGGKGDVQDIVQKIEISPY